MVFVCICFVETCTVCSRPVLFMDLWCYLWVPLYILYKTYVYLYLSILFFYVCSFLFLYVVICCFLFPFLLLKGFVVLFKDYDYVY